MLYNILLIDDNPQIRDTERAEWKKYGGCLTNVYTAQEAIREFEQREYHLIKIVVDFVGESLFPFIKKLRVATDMPIIVMTSTYDGIEKVAALRCGADEYFQTPETLEEIVMTGFAHIRRYCSFDCGRHDKNIVSFHGIRMDLRDRKITINGEEVHFSRGEFECLRMIMSHPGRLFSYDLLYYGSFGEEARSEDVMNSIRSLITRIRQKLGSEHSKLIKTVHGIGYKIDKAG